MGTMTLRLTPKAMAKIPPKKLATLPVPAKPVRKQMTEADKIAREAEMEAEHKAAVQRRRMENKKLQKTLTERFPAAFNRHRPQPLKVGISDDISAAIGIPRKKLNGAMIHWTTRKDYLRAMTAGAVRIDLDGNPTGTVTEEQAEIAAQKLAEQMNRVH